MEAERWQRIESIFHAARLLTLQERVAYLAEACAEDRVLQAQVASLLDSGGDDDAFLETPAFEVAARLAAHQEAAARINQKFGSYHILKLLGAGGMGEVYLAHDKRLGRKIALKLLSAELTQEREFLRRFEQEARAASALNHPNILTIHEIGEIEGQRFIATEFIEGETLRRQMRQGQIQLKDVLDIITQVASALAAAHQAGIIHRDIKPENVMLREDRFVKVLDFGLAKLSGEQETSPGAATEMKVSSQTTPGMVMGTPGYMSPEQARGKAVDARTDIFSLGVMLYEMLAGQAPFAGETASDCIALVLTSEPAPVQNFDENISTELETIIAKTLAKDREERYQTTKELLVDLSAVKKRLEFEGELERSAFTNVRRNSGKAFKTGPQNSIAVLPFANMSADIENEYFCDGLAEELLNALAKIDDLKVAARTSAFSFKGKNTNVSEIGKALNVKTVLEGSVRRSGRQLRITVQLINSSDGYHLWSERYDLGMKDIFDVQDEITLAVVGALKVKLLGKEKAAVLKRYTANADAYLLYLKGMYYRWRLTPEEFGKCLRYFQQSVDADPSFALGHFGVASYYGYGTAWGLLSLPPEEGWRQAEAAIARVLELDNTMPELHLTMAAFKLVNQRDWDAAGKAIEHAVSLNPKFPEIYHLYSFYLLAAGRFDDAIAAAQRALELDPLSLNYSRFLGICFHFARHYDEAVEQFKQTLELDPNNASVHQALGDAYERLEGYGEAVAEWHRAMTLDGDEELAAILTRAYAEADFLATIQAVAQQKLERMSARADSGEFVLAIGFARAYVLLGDKELALYWLEKACAERNVFPLLMNSDPFYDNVRSDKRFQDLLRLVGGVADKLETLGGLGAVPSQRLR
jgi:serine/threonine protein kinase